MTGTSHRVKKTRATNMPLSAIQNEISLEVAVQNQRS